MPSGHSHSSHSSHSRGASHHSSSSHRSSSHRSYSRHSSSSHRSGSSYSGFGSLGSLFWGGSSSRSHTTRTKIRTTPHVYASKPTADYDFLSCICGKDHDYRCFGSEWKDSDGVAHKPGWYDENNNRFDAVAKKGSSTVLCTCSYCDTTTTFNIKDQSQVEYECPNCGAPLKIQVVEEDKEDIIVSSDFSDSEMGDYSGSDGGHKGLLYLILVVAALIIIPFVLPSYHKSDDDRMKESINQQLEDMEEEVAETKQTKQTKQLKLTSTGDNSYSVSESGNYDKVLTWDGENYYDSELNYYLWYNDEVGQYQYWYEPISGDYGDYGWMEYDPKDSNWYIEIEDRNWIVVPDKYDTSVLYHIE